YDLEPSGVGFRVPATLTTAYDPPSLPAGTDETTLRVFYLHADGPRTLANAAVDAAAHTVSAPIVHFTRYGISSSWLSVDWRTFNADVEVSWTQSAAVVRTHVGRTCAADASGRFDPTCLGCNEADLGAAPPAGTQDSCWRGAGILPNCQTLP